eukprot:GHVU01011455.1.p1 GENE.GHVU01011455.1~~GHVU01011455.1.p1  ORF type:complete len:164 (+),score=13.94 GHVU01011455.1:182-673(+)
MELFDDMEAFADSHGEVPAPPRLVRGPGIGADVDFSRWYCVYPNYIDSQKSAFEGRRIAATDGVPKPTCLEVAEACESMGLAYVLEDKAYPRDWLVRGRVRVNCMAVRGVVDAAGDTRTASGAKKDLYKRIARRIPEIRSAIAPQQEAGPSSSSTKTKKKKRK